ncbi:PAS domain S-box protein [Candidatus Sumerlaeota bacterium]|nr:PAS domain S-box protein [Candidatus Sumerlaeota bacterium]
MITGKRRILLLMIVMSVVAIAAMVISLHVLYQAAFSEERDRLREIVRSRARLMEAIARFDQQHADLIREADPSYDPIEATLSQMREAHRQFVGFGETGEFTLARLEGDQIVFLLRHRHVDVDVPEPVPLSSSLAEPMRRALAGESGWLVGLDYRGETVLAAHEPVAWMGLGIVAKIDMAEIRAPFVRAGLLAALGALIIILLGAVILHRIGSPLVAEVLITREFTEAAIDAQTDTFFLFDPRTGKPLRWNRAFREISGYTDEEIAAMRAPDDWYSPGDVERAARCLERAFSEGTATVELDLITKSGARHPTEYKAAVIHDAHGDPLHVIAIGRDLTERRASERALRESEALFRAMFEQAAVGVAQVETQTGRFLRVNQRCCEIVGLSPEDLTSRTFMSISHPDELQADIENLERMKAGEIRSYTMEKRHFRPDGSTVWVTLTASPMWSPGEEPTSHIAVVEDITGRRRTEEALRVSEETARSLLNATHDAAQLLDREGIILDVNESMARWMGLSREELIGACVFDLMPPEEVQGRRDLFDRLFESGEVILVEEQVRNLCLHTTLYPLLDASGRVSRVGVFIEDVTERETAERALRESERFLHGVFESIQDGISIIDRDMNIVRVNRWMREMYSHQAPLEGKKCHRAYQERDDECPWCPTRLAFETGETQRAEVPYPSEDHVEGWIELSSFPLRDEGGEVVLVIESVKDISERKRSEQALRESQAQLTNAQRLAHLGNWLWDVRTGEVTCSEEMCRIFGMEPEECQHHIDTLASLFHPDDRHLFEDAMAHARDQRGELIFQARIIRPDGEMRYLFSVSEGVHDEGGNLTGIMGTLQDITEAHRAEEALRESEERLRLAMMAANQGLYDLNVQTGETIVSPMYALMLGYDPDEFIETNERWRDRLHPDDQEQVYRVYEECIRGERDIYQVEFRQRTSTGDWKWILSLGSIVEWDREGRPLRMLGTHADITDLRRAERALLAEKNFTDVLIRGLPGIFYLFDEEGRMLRWNRNFEEMSGYSGDEIGRMRATDFFTGSDRDVIAERIREVFTGGQSVAEAALVTKSGEEIPHFFTGVRLTTEAGAFLLGVGLDITDRKRAEEALRRSEALLNDTQRITQIGGWECDVETGRMTWTEEVYRIHEMPVDPGMGHVTQSLECYDPEDKERVEQAFRRAVEEGEPYDLEARFTTAKGKRLWVRTTARAERRDGKVVRVVGNIMDITERRRAEEIRESLARLARKLTGIRALGEIGPLLAEEARALFDHDAFYISVFDETSRAVRGIYAEDTFPGADAPLTVPLRDHSLSDESAAQIYSGIPRLINREESVREPGADLIPFGEESHPSRSLMFVPLMWGGRIIGDISVQSYTPGKYSERDLTIFEHFAAQCGGALLRLRIEEERRRLEEKIQQTQKMESLGVLAGGIAHDFNNLLMGILGNANLALDEMSPESPARYSIQQIEMATRRAADLTKQMLAYSGKGRFVIKPLDLSHLVEEMLHMMQVSISKKAVLRLDLAKSLPAIRADATQIRQIVMNLITNASEAIGDRSGVIAITTGAMECDREYLSTTHLDTEMREGLFVTLEVSDTGEGMDAETQAKIFDPFFTTKFTGRGLGLAAVLGIVRGHRGAIRVYSEPRKGTTFKILFPASEDQAESLERRRTAETQWRGSGTILVADDEETIRALARRILARAGFDVLTAEHGLSAVETFREHAHEITAVLLDMTMPHMDGEQVFREMRRIRPDVRVILSSGYNEQDATQRFSGEGLAGFIQKPYSPADLIAKLREILGG